MVLTSKVSLILKVGKPLTMWTSARQKQLQIQNHRVPNTKIAVEGEKNATQDEEEEEEEEAVLIFFFFFFLFQPPLTPPPPRARQTDGASDLGRWVKSNLRCMLKLHLTNDDDDDDDGDG